MLNAFVGLIAAPKSQPSKINLKGKRRCAELHDYY
jgi:hypothetical protein